MDPILVTSTGNLRPHYSMVLGHLIKQRLWDKLRCPSMMEEEQVQDSEQVHYAEKFSAPSVTNFASHVHVDISGLQPKITLISTWMSYYYLIQHGMKFASTKPEADFMKVAIH
ncbi:hypothetical protein QTP70_007698 [Hemibagrus guttatus]|uniref:Uncharacterized protein n=1 Tax=Hemibagrus guttatus TaxID=175788 RepID=A0AAE0V9W6_9TELE|nr:hypothetical protein QTP70_007698 [Hemibagrus guttatus]KAK3566782.1 hypothetical protein QTP86_004521 [Hemibagrus guttatus]